jgi:hypothetical protein
MIELCSYGNTVLMVPVKKVAIQWLAADSALNKHLEHSFHGAAGPQTALPVGG